MRKFWLKHPSTYFALVSWGVSAFMAQPTMASGVAHFVINPFLLAAIIWLARHEGKGTAFST